MSISWLFWWIYQLDREVLVWSFLGCTLLFLWLHRHCRERLWWRGVLGVLFLLWTGAALWVTVLNRNGGTGEVWLYPLFHSYRTFADTGNWEILHSNSMNVLLFYPAGLLIAASLPNRWGRGRRALTGFAVFGLFSLSIELVQYWQLLGQAELDDVLHNTLGAVLGSIMIPKSTSEAT